MSNRDVTVYLPANREDYVPLGEATFIYLKECPIEVTVVLDGAKIIMASGDEQTFEPGDDQTQMTVINNTSSPVQATFIVGRGQFRRTRLFAGVEGAIGVRSTLLNDNGDILDNTVTERILQISIDDETRVQENGSDTILSSTEWPQNNVVGSPFNSTLYEVHTWDQHRRADKKFRMLDSDNDTFSTTVGAAVGTFQGAFLHPFTGKIIICSTDALGTGYRMHERDLKQRVNREICAMTAGDGEDFIAGNFGGPSVDWYTGNLFAKFSNEECREFRWVTTPTLAGLRYSLETVQDRTFAGLSGNTSSIHRLGDGRFICGQNGQAIKAFDTDENDNAALGDYNNLADVSGDETGFGGTAPQFLIDERTNRTWIGKSTTSLVGALFDLDADVRLNIHDAANYSANFEHWKKGMPVTGVQVVRDGGYRFLAGSVLAACVKLVRGSNLIPADYMDYIYAVEFHNGTGRVKVDGGRSSFLKLNYADGYRVNIDEPIVIHARAGLLDQPISLYINDNLDI